MRNFLTRSLAIAVLVAAGTPLKADDLTTTFAGGAISGANWTNYFNLTVSNPQGIRFTDFTVFVAQSSPPHTLNVYVRPSTYVGFETTPAAWTLTSTGTSNANIVNGADKINTTDFILPTGTYGFALVHTNYQTQFSFSTTDYSDTNLVIDNGAIADGPLSGNVFSNPAVWNGTISYTVVPEPSVAVLVSLAAIAFFRRRICNG